VAIGEVEHGVDIDGDGDAVEAPLLHGLGGMP
jgi:hypothetical protein